MKTIFAGSSSGFLAYLSSNVKGNANKYLHFDTEKYDHGNNYDPATGVYKVPYDGIYLVQARVYGFEKNANHCILVDGARATFTAESSGTDKEHSGTTSIVLELSAGQEVAVELWFSGTVHGSNDYMVTSFEASLLYPN